MKLLNPFLLFCLFLFLVPMAGHSQEFVYRPVNPAFGGNYLNYQWLLNSAQAQSPFEEEQPERDPFTR
ncbi:MAG: curli assembly protein CsgF, partial [Bacteroidales bacterium]